MVINIHFKPFRGLICHLNILREGLFFQGREWSSVIKSQRQSGLEPANPISVLTGLTFHLSVPLQGARVPPAEPEFLDLRLLHLNKMNKQPAHWCALHTGPEELSLRSHCSVLWLADDYHGGTLWETHVSGKMVHFLTLGRHPYALFRKETYLCKENRGIGFGRGLPQVFCVQVHWTTSLIHKFHNMLKLLFSFWN